MRKIDLTGQRFGHLIVEGDAEKLPGNKNRRFLCRCDCGCKIIVFYSNLRSGNTKSCGCEKGEWMLQHGKTRRRSGERKPRLYSIWDNMKQRCYNPHNTSYPYYGGRGIKVCHEWVTSFEAFYVWAISHGYNDDLTIDRIDNDGNYEPSNCQWISLSANIQKEKKKK